MKMRGVGLLLVAVLLAAGCDKQVKPGPMPDVSKVFTQVDTLLRDGNTNGALAVLSDAMVDKTYAQNRSWFYSYILNILLSSDRIDEAKARYLGVIGKDDELVRAGFSTMSSYYQGKGGDAQEAWVQQMVVAPLPKDLLAQAYGWQLGILRSKGEMDKIVDLVPVLVKTFDAGTNRRLLGDAVNSELAAERYDNAGKLLDAIEKKAGSVRELKDMAAIDRTDILFMRGEWPAAEQQFVAVAAGLADGELSGWIPRVIGRCIGKQQLDLADKLCDSLLKNQKDKPGARGQAASQWIEVAKERKDWAAVPARLETLLGLNVSPQVLLMIYGREFYSVMGENKKELVVAMVAFGDKLDPLLTKEDDKAQIRAMALDGVFITEDYARSLKILEMGIQGRDKSWHEMAINKAKAHLALQQGKSKEAVEYFRKFMNGIAVQWDKPEQDPISGIFCSKEMCLGRNAKRIGDIWAGAGDPKASADAYVEAKGYYDKALADVKADSKEAEVIKAEMAAIPAPK